MRRRLAVIPAVIAAIIGLGGAGTANAAGQSEWTGVPYDAYISEFSTRGIGADATFKEFIELANRSQGHQPIGGYQLVASFGARTMLIARVPDWTVLAPGETYLLASPRFTGPAPDQLLATEFDLPDGVGISLMNRTGELVDTVATTYNTLYLAGTPAAPLTGADAAAKLSIHRTQFTGDPKSDFLKLRSTPGMPG